MCPRQAGIGLISGILQALGALGGGDDHFFEGARLSSSLNTCACPCKGSDFSETWAADTLVEAERLTRKAAWYLMAHAMTI
jgi:hypothetical protein